MLTPKRLKFVLRYDPVTGYFTWIACVGNRVRLGTRAGCINNKGYRTIRIDGILYYEHALAYFYMTGRWAEPTVDHRNECKSDNRWENLREATHLDQQQNITKPQENNGCGERYIGYHKAKDRYRVRIVRKGCTVLATDRKTLAEAMQVRDIFLSTA